MFEDSTPNCSTVIDRKPFDWILLGQGQSDLDLWPRDLKNKRGLLFVMTNLQTKVEDSRPNHSLVIDQKTIDLPTDRPTDMCKAIIPPLFSTSYFLHRTILTTYLFFTSFAKRSLNFYNSSGTWPIYNALKKIAAPLVPHGAHAKGKEWS